MTMALAHSRVLRVRGAERCSRGAAPASTSSLVAARRRTTARPRAAGDGSGGTSGSGAGNQATGGLYFLDKLVEDPVNALLVLGPRALAGAIDSLPKNADEFQAETEQVRDRLTMLAQDPRPWDVKGELVVREADSKLEELVEKGSKALAGGSEGSKAGASAAATAEVDEEEERNYQDLSRKVAEFSNLYLLLREVRKSEARYLSAEESDAKMLFGVVEDTRSSLSHRLDELTEGLEEDFVLPFGDLLEDAREALAAPIPSRSPPEPSAAEEKD